MRALRSMLIIVIMKMRLLIDSYWHDGYRYHWLIAKAASFRRNSARQTTTVKAAAGAEPSRAEPGRHAVGHLAGAGPARIMLQHTDLAAWQNSIFQRGFSTPSASPSSDINRQYGQRAERIHNKAPRRGGDCRVHSVNYRASRYFLFRQTMNHQDALLLLLLLMLLLLLKN